MENNQRGRVMVFYGRANGIWTGTPAVFDRPFNETFGESLAAGDFNDDGYTDLAIGSPLAAPVSGGGVWVFHGTPLGLSTSGSQFWSQNSEGVSGAAENGDHFGASLAAGNFGKDGADDLAIGVTLEAISGTDGATSAGMVHIIYGNHGSGLSSTGSQTWHRNTDGIPGACVQGETFGYKLASGNFGRGSYKDLAISIAGASVDGKLAAGSVLVLYGANEGLTATNNDILTKKTSYVPGEPQALEGWGAFALVAGRFNNDDYDDIVIGSPRDSEIASTGGSVTVIYATSGGWGFSAVGPVMPQQWTQNSGIGGSTEAGDFFGASVAAGDVNDDGISDLIVGARNETVESSQSVVEAGMINVIYGTASGLTTAGEQNKHQDSSGIEETAEAHDHFGWAVTVGDFDGDGVDDVAVGAPEDSATTEDADRAEGLINVIEGRAGTGLTGSEGGLLTMPH